MPTRDDPARLLLVRHGEIEANARQVWHGSTDSPLTDLGHRQARRVAQHLRRSRPAVAAVYASPLERCRHTAEPIAVALGLEPRLDADLVEFGIGELEGVSYLALMQEHRFFQRIFSDPDYAPPGGESVRAVTERVLAALRRIADAHAGEDAVLVGHGAAIGLALGHLLHGEWLAWRRYQLSNASVSELVLDPEPRLLSFDATEHLDAG